MLAAMLADAAPRERPVQRYEPRGGARELLLASDQDILIVGPAGTGKTLAACYKAHFALLKYPGSRVLMCRRVLEDLKTGMLTTYINGVKPTQIGVHPFGGNRFYQGEFRYPNGSVLLAVGLDKPGKVMSSEFDMILFNEATEAEEDEAWQKLKSRLRHGVMPNQQIIGDANPTHPDHWLNQRCNDGRTRRILSFHKDNPAYWDYRNGDWTPLGRQYVVETLGDLTGAERARLLEGKWVKAEGLVYPMFVQEMIHAQDTEHWRRVMGVDIGSTNPTAILTAHVAGDERLHVSREFYATDLSSDDILEAICAQADECDPYAIYIDPSAKGVILALQARGYPAVAANNELGEGIRQVKAVLKPERFSIDPSCTNTIREFGLYSWPKRPTSTAQDKPEKKNDHSMDGLRYLCMGALEPSVDLAAYYGSMSG